jgi:thiamine biosynthesis lipoprotein
MNEHRFDAMGCEVVLGGAAASAAPAVEELFRVREQTFSRFVADSELNRVNAAAGREMLVSPLFADTLRLALDARDQTGGLVDPTLGAALVSVGYGRDSSELVPDPRPPGPTQGARPVFALGSVVALPEGVHLDLNGVVKSMAVDDALALCRGEGFVSAGGDVAAHGPLTVALPDGDAVELRQGALATSGTTKRWWQRGGAVQHHLLDPKTGRPARTPWTSVTACGATCVAADVAAKAGFLAGEDGPAWLDVRGIPARFVTVDGRVVVNGAWARSIREAVSCT